MKYIIHSLLLMALSCDYTSGNLIQSPKDVVKATQEVKAVQTKETKHVLGIDVSHFQGDVDWESVKQSGVYFGYAKATQGGYYVDPLFVKHIKGMTSAGVYSGAYHFFVYQDNAVTQAQNFLHTLGDLKTDLPVVLDLESGGLDGKVDTESYQKAVLTWLEYVEKTTGRKPMIYTDTSFGNTYLNHPDFAVYDLWLADYVKENPTVPETWKTKGWMLWQKDDSGEVSGVNGTVDQDIFNGNLKAFKSKMVKH